MDLLDEFDEHSTICALSADIRFLIKELKSGATLQDKIILNQLLKKTRLVQRKAQKMEKRLKRYRNSIESLGFVRTY